MKWCPDCEQELPRAAFGANRAASDGMTAYCKPCHNTRTRANVEKHHGSTRDAHLKRRYGLDSAAFDAMAEAQGGVCALCGTRPPQHVDHDHVTGRVRGLLCSGCNQGLGNFRDDAATLRLAAEYVERHSWQRRQEAPGVFCMVPPRDPAAALQQGDLDELLARRRRAASDG